MKGECTVASGCGKGIRTSTRVCLQGTCVGVKTKTESCGEVLVPGRLYFYLYTGIGGQKKSKYHITLCLKIYKVHINFF